MIKELKQIANTISQQSKESKVKAVCLTPVLVPVLIAIKTEEMITDSERIYKGKVYKTKYSRNLD